MCTVIGPTLLLLHVIQSSSTFDASCHHGYAQVCLTSTAIENLVFTTRDFVVIGGMTMPFMSMLRSYIRLSDLLIP